MKRIIKGTEPSTFTDWKAKANEDWQPSYGDLQNPQKKVLHEALLAEQAGVCCYCGRAISLTDSHIEHFRPQESYENLALDYANLYASCIRQNDPGTPRHCGHAKGNDFDERKALSPLELSCEQRFIYSAHDGAILPAAPGDECAAYMVGLLKLDIRFLRNQRAEALKSVFDDEFVSSATDEDLARLAQAYREPDAQGRLTSFGHVLSRYAEQLLGTAA